MDGHGNDRFELPANFNFKILNCNLLSGLDINVNRVMQVAMLVTDANLNVISTDFNTMIHQSDEAIENMNEWCKQNMQELAEESKKSQVSELQAEDMMLAFIKQYVTQPRLSPLAGNSIYMDRMFLRKYFPRVDEYLHYRIIDVSTVKELCGRWNKKAYTSAPQKKLEHRALEDIKESINELKHYKEKFFICDK